ncbi:MAG: radical SAM family heme chaperone HemW [Clostridiales bacterium]|nr:radical SAM family heme chaperone HemW [Clostridiales bacterium]
MAGLYIHIPFCKAKCRYCDFVSFTDHDCMGDYCAALLKEMRLSAAALPKREYGSVFFGGGTPSILPVGAISLLLHTLKENFAIAPDAEITIEANPGTLTDEKLKEYKTAGINRLSMGLQSAKDVLLENVGRIHCYREFVQNYECARAAGFDNISADIMYGLPGQTVKDHMDTIEVLYKLALDHISAYSLIVEEGTPLYTDIVGGAESLPAEDDAYLMHKKGMEFLEQLGYRRYEISNYAKPGKESRHNVNYWENGEYLGLGLNSHSAMRVEGQWLRFANTASLSDYIAGSMHGVRPLAEPPEVITEKEEMFETVMLGLRMTKGLDEAKFLERFGKGPQEVYAPEISVLQEKGWLLRENGFMKLTEEGLDFQNEALLAFLED